MVCYKWHCPCAHWILLHFEGHDGVVLVQLEVFLKSIIIIHRALIAAVKLRDLHLHAEEVLRHRMECDSSDFDGAVTDDSTPFRLILALWLQKMFPVGQEPRVRA